MADKKKEKEEGEIEREGAADGPLLDLSDDAVKKMIKAAKKRGYITMDELNTVLPSEETDPDKIEDTLAMLSDMGINVVEEEDNTDEDKEEAAEEEVDANELARRRYKARRDFADTHLAQGHFRLGLGRFTSLLLAGPHRVDSLETLFKSAMRRLRFTVLRGQ